MSEVRRQIVAMGRVCFRRNRNPVLDDFPLSLSRRAKRAVCFKAPMDSENYFLRFCQAFAGRECRPTPGEAWGARGSWRTARGERAE